MFHSWILDALDLYDEALEAVTRGARAAQRDRQNFALQDV